MAPKKAPRGKAASTSRQPGRSAKTKYSPILAHTQTLTQNDPESSEDDESSTQNNILGHPVPAHLLRNLSGDGQAQIKMNIIFTIILAKVCHGYLSYKETNNTRWMFRDQEIKFL